MERKVHTVNSIFIRSIISKSFPCAAMYMIRDHFRNDRIDSHGPIVNLVQLIIRLFHQGIVVRGC